MIEGYCFTNLDNYGREEWPTHFVSVPREGEWVKSASGKILTVVKVTHEMSKNKTVSGYGPRIRVELHR